MPTFDTYKFLTGDEQKTAQEIFQLLDGETYRNAMYILEAVTTHIKFCARVTAQDETDS